MKCPYCNYENGWNPEKCEQINGIKGDFYTLTVPFSRTQNWEKQYIETYACPSCGRAFIDIGE